MTLTRGYLRGHFSFKYPQPFSRLRERYVSSFIERDTAAEVIRTRALINSSFVGLNTKENMVEKTFEAFKEYTSIMLPSRQTIVKIEEIQKDKLANLKDALKALKAARPSKPKTK